MSDFFSGLAQLVSPVISPAQSAFGVVTQQVAPIPHEEDAIDRICNEIDAATDAGCTKRECVMRALEQLRREVAPVIRSSRGKQRPPSRKAVRRVIGPLDHLIAEGRARRV